ncbi:MAG: hypothetical protein ACLFTV_09375 [Desulfococcaceae bacterium]
MSIEARIAVDGQPLEYCPPFPAPHRRIMLGNMPMNAMRNCDPRGGILFTLRFYWKLGGIGEDGGGLNRDGQDESRMVSGESGPSVFILFHPENSVFF